MRTKVLLFLESLSVIALKNIRMADMKGIFLLFDIKGRVNYKESLLFHYQAFKHVQLSI